MIEKLLEWEYSWASGSEPFDFKKSLNLSLGNDFASVLHVAVERVHHFVGVCSRLM
jgi:hypothetical protein